MPAFVMLGSIYLSLGSGSGLSFASLWQTTTKAFTNPIIIASFAGILASAIAHFIPLGMREQGWFATPTLLVGDVLKLLGSMGPPLALICVGASVACCRGWHPLASDCLRIPGQAGAYALAGLCEFYLVISRSAAGWSRSCGVADGNTDGGSSICHVQTTAGRPRISSRSFGGQHGHFLYQYSTVAVFPGLISLISFACFS